MLHYRLHRFYYALLRFLFSGVVFLKMNYSCEYVKDVDAPYIVLVNHVTDLDPVLLGMSFQKHMYFVASEHVFRAGFLSKLLVHIFAPIPRVKGGVAAGTVMELFRRLRAGHNVCIFAEGNRSYNGETLEILPSTGKVVKNSRASLVTYRLIGGYLTSPRWSFSMRRGRMRGELAGVYSAQQLSAMSVDEVNALIRRDLYENAFERQKAEPVRYRGKGLAEGLETALFLCPACGGLGTLHAQGNTLRCDCCSLCFTYSEYGLFENAPFKTMLEWDCWQMAELEKRSEGYGEEAVFADAQVRLLQLESGHRASELTVSKLRMYRDRLECGAYVFPIAEIADMAIHGRSTLIFSTSGGSHYELKPDGIMNARKYLHLYKIYKKDNKYGLFRE